MGRIRQRAGTAVLLLAAACGGGGGADVGNGVSGAFGTVRLLGHEPSADAVQVPLGAVVDLVFDADMALDSFGDADTWLRPAGGAAAVPGAFTRGSNGRVRFTPAAPLAPETDYVFQLSPLTCDEAGRILDATVTFAFRTFDATPPQIVGADVAANATGVARTRSFTVTCNEAIAPGSLGDGSFYLRDLFGIRYASLRSVSGSTVTLAPLADLPGDRQCFLVLTTAVTDRAGNALVAGTTIPFRTAVDATPPSVVSVWPPLDQTGVSPLVQPTVTFDESMDPATVEAVSLLFQDSYGTVVSFTIEASPDQRTLRVRPRNRLANNRRYTLAFLLGAAAATDVSGNPLAATQAVAFTTGTDATPPAVSHSVPAAAETRVPGSLVATVTFAEPLDPARVSAATVGLTAAGIGRDAVVELVGGTTVRVTPVLDLPVSTSCVLSLRGGQDGLRDLAGNVLATDVAIPFTTSTDAGEPGVILLPPDGAANVAPASGVRFVFDAPMDPATLTAATVLVTDDLGNVLPGELTVGDRVVAFTPAVTFAASTYYRLAVRGGRDGARRASGNWFPADRTARFRTGTAGDNVAPTVTATVNGIAGARTAGLVLPPAGFTVDVAASDVASQWVDMGSVEVRFEGPGTAPGAAALLSAARIGYGTFQVAVPAATPLTDGTWQLSVRVRDLAGNVGTSNVLPFTVASPNGNMLPFERTQVVWLRTDLDRDANGRPDFDDDLLRLGFASAGDPAGTNAWMRSLVLDGIVATASRLYGRGSRGEPIDGGSVALRFTQRLPIGIPHMQMALGGFDPEGARNRVYGDESTGVLGRAYYDHRNGNVAERNTASSPGLGVFGGEMWLYQTRIHLQVYPAFQTVFAQRFLPLCPDMGGVPAGSHPLDAAVLGASFDYATATSEQRARWQTVMDAADDWATVIGIVLAHEVGHSIGLVAPGPAPGGLFGDSSLHDSFAAAAEVMAPSVGYEAMTSLDYAFRDVDLAYLRQRLLLP